MAVAAQLVRAGLKVIATEGTARAIDAAGVEVETVNKLSEAGGPDIVDLLGAGRVDLVINTPSGRGARSDGAAIRVAAIRAGIPCLTTIEAAAAAARAIRAEAEDALAPLALQDLGAAVGARIIGAGAEG